MFPNQDDGPSQPTLASSKRPASLRNPSSSYGSQSQSGGEQPSASHRPSHPKAQRYVVGRRNVSFKNLAALKPTGHLDPGDGPQRSPRLNLHRRSLSGNLVRTPQGSPRIQSDRLQVHRHGMKRNASAHTVGLRRNHSSTVLPRHGSSKNMAKAGLPPLNKTRKTTPPPKEANPTVRFDIGDDPDGDDDHEWTEDSNSLSPVTTRDHTRSNSVVADRETTTIPTATADTSQSTRLSQSASHPNLPSQAGPSTTRSSSRPPDADILTSRLLQRSAKRHNPVPPQITPVVANDVRHDPIAGATTARLPEPLSQSQGSTLAGTPSGPSSELVSRFINGAGGSSGTPNHGSSFFPSRPTPTSEAHSRRSADSDASDIDDASIATGVNHRRTASARAAGAPSSAGALTTPPDPSNPVHQSRTQQKLWLQRASSNLEPMKNIPAIIPRTMTGPLLLPLSAASSAYGPGYAVAGSGSTPGAGGRRRIDPRLQRQFDQVAGEYAGVRRFRDPIAEGLMRVTVRVGEKRRPNGAATGATGTTTTTSSSTPEPGRGAADGQASRGAASVAEGFLDDEVEDDGTPTRRGETGNSAKADRRARDPGGSRRSRVSFEVPGALEAAEDGTVVTGEESDDRERERERRREREREREREAYEVCRRLWEIQVGRA